MHAFELALPLIVLSIIGAESWSSRLGAGETELGDSGRWRWSAFPAALLAAFIATAWLGFVPVRAAALGQVSTHLKTALDAPVRAGLEKAVVFSPWPFAPPCGGTPNHYVNFRPVNDPDLATNVLWVNHLDVETDRRLMATLPGRSGYVLRWTERCEVVLLPLDSLTAADVPPGVVRRPRD